MHCLAAAAPRPAGSAHVCEGAHAEFRSGSDELGGGVARPRGGRGVGASALIVVLLPRLLLLSLLHLLHQWCLLCRRHPHLLHNHLLLAHNAGHRRLLPVLVEELQLLRSGRSGRRQSHGLRHRLQQRTSVVRMLPQLLWRQQRHDP